MFAVTAWSTRWLWPEAASAEAGRAARPVKRGDAASGFGTSAAELVVRIPKVEPPTQSLIVCPPCMQLHQTGPSHGGSMAWGGGYGSSRLLWALRDRVLAV